MKKVMTIVYEGLAGLGLILLFFIIYSMFNSDTIISFQNESNYSLFYFFLAFVIFKIIYQVVFKKKEKD